MRAWARSETGVASESSTIAVLTLHTLHSVLLFNRTVVCMKLANFFSTKKITHTGFVTLPKAGEFIDKKINGHFLDRSTRGLPKKVSEQRIW